MMCPSCRGEDVRLVRTSCPSVEEPGETLAFPVCADCDYGINDHTEGLCGCVRRDRCDFCDARATRLDVVRGWIDCGNHPGMVMYRTLETRDYARLAEGRALPRSWQAVQS